MSTEVMGLSLIMGKASNHSVLTAANAHVPMHMACRPTCMHVTVGVNSVCASEQYVGGSEKSQRPPVRPSVRHTRDPRLNGSRYRKILHHRIERCF